MWSRGNEEMVAIMATYSLKVLPHDWQTRCAELYAVLKDAGWSEQDVRIWLVTPDRSKRTPWQNWSGGCAERVLLEARALAAQAR